MENNRLESSRAGGYVESTEKIVPAISTVKP